MAPRDWFRPPQSSLTLYLSGAVLAVGCMVWLGARQLNQDAAVEQQRTRQRLEGIAAAVAAQSQLALKEFERLLTNPSIASSSDVVIATRSAAGVLVVHGALPFVPVAPLSSMVPPGIFDSGEALEFGKDALPRAVDVYRSLALSPDPAIRAGALMRLGRVHRRAARPAEATDAYAKMSRLTDVVIDGRPADLIALRATCATLAEAGQTVSLEREANVLRRDLAAGRWPITRDLWQSLFEEASVWAGPGATQFPNLQQDLAVAAALESFWSTDAEDRPAHVIFTGAAGPTLVLSMRQGEHSRALLAGPRQLDRLWRQLSFDPTFNLALSGREGEPFAGRAGSGAMQLAADQTGLPWTIAVMDADPDLARAQAKARKVALLSALALVSLLIVSSAYFTHRGVRREVAAIRLQSEFIATVSHEFRTPLTSLRQLSSMLQSGRVESEERRARYYDLLVRESERLHSLVERLLSFGRVDSAGYRFEVVDLREVVASVTQEFESRTDERRITVSSPAVGCPVRADREMLSLSVWNLIDNAVKYSPEGAAVRIEVEVHGAAVAVAVHDRGIGIRPEDRQRIFKRFVRGNPDDTRGRPGSGLGLALVQRVVGDHGGKIAVTSEVGRGTSFLVTLPLETT